MARAGGPGPAEQEALVRSALEKRRRKKRLSRAEEAALRRAKRDEEERILAAGCAALPKKTYRAWSGRQHKTLDEQAVRYGVPIDGPTVDLAKVVRWLHDFLAANALRLAKEEDREPDTVELIRREQLAARQLERRKLERTLVDRAEVHAALVRAAGLIRKAGEILQRHHGPGALATLNDALSNADREIGELFPHALTGGDDGNPE